MIEIIKKPLINLLRLSKKIQRALYGRARASNSDLQLASTIARSTKPNLEYIALETRSMMAHELRGLNLQLMEIRSLMLSSEERIIKESKIAIEREQALVMKSINSALQSIVSQVPPSRRNRT